MVTRAEAAEVVTALDWRDEVSVLAADRIRVAAVDRLGGITPAMIEWWFSRMDEPTYFQFHPVDHKAFAWVRGKTPGAHIGATHLTHHCYGGQPPLLPSEITFIPPSELLEQPDAVVAIRLHAVDGAQGALQLAAFALSDELLAGVVRKDPRQEQREIAQPTVDERTLLLLDQFRQLDQPDRIELTEAMAPPTATGFDERASAGDVGIRSEQLGEK